MAYPWGEAFKLLLLTAVHGHPVPEVTFTDALAAPAGSSVKFGGSV